MEDPKLEFGSSGDDFFEIFGPLGTKNAGTAFDFKQKLCNSSLELKLIVLPSIFGVEIFPRSGWPAVSPPGRLSIRRPPKVCQRRAKLLTNWLCPITAGQSRHSFAHFDLKCSFPYPFLCSWGPPQTRSQKAEKFAFFAFFLDFVASRTALEKRHRKNIEKKTKIEDFGLPNPSQNPPKILSKSAALRCSARRVKSHRHFLLFNICISLLGGDRMRNWGRVWEVMLALFWLLFRS